VFYPRFINFSLHLHVVSFGPPSNMFEERYDEQWEKANDGSGRQRQAPPPSRGVSMRQGSTFAPPLGLVDAAVHGVHSDLAATFHLFPTRLRV